MKQLIAAASLFALIAVPATADDYVTPLDPVPGHGEVTYADLLRLVIPDLDIDGSGHLPEGIVHIDGPEMTGETPETVNITSLEIRTIEAEGSPTIWVMADIGEGGNLGTYTLLAAFDDGATPKLLDAVEVDSDRLTGFIGQKLRISDKDEAALIDSEHSNSSQTYQSEPLVFLKGGKFAVVDDFFAFGTQSCSSVQYEELKVEAAPIGDAYWPITATVTRSIAGTMDTPSLADESGDEDSPPCIEPEFPADFTHKDFSATYTWDAAAGKYATTSGALDELSEADQQLF